MKPNLHIEALAPYALADLSAPRSKRLVSLAQNESAFPSSPKAIDAAVAALADCALYPDPDWTELRAAIGEVHGIDPAKILCGSGSMDLICAIAQAYLGPDHRALTTEFGYLFFRTATRLTGADFDLAAETELTVDIDALLAAVTPATKAVFLANPGNPTGTYIARADLVRLRDGLPAGVLLVIDEAYGEFADLPGEATFDLVDRENTVILRTFSKAYALAGMRVGWGVFPSAIAEQVRKVLNPNNISFAAQAAAAAAMRDQRYMRDICAKTAALRDEFCAHLRALDIDIPQSHTNFALLRFANAEQARSADAALRDEGIFMRAMGGYGLPECLRTTIGSEEDMAMTVTILTTWKDNR